MIARQNDIWHLVERGIIAEITLDTETAGVNRLYNTILECGVVVSDLAGEVLSADALHGKVPDYRTVSPQAALVNRRTPDRWDDGDPPAIIAGKIAEQFFRAPQRVYDHLDDEIQIVPIKHGIKGKTETVRLMPYQDDDGNIQHIRLHQGGKYVSWPVTSGKIDYHDSDGQGWRKKKAGIQVNHYYGIRADDPWLWSLFDQAQMPDIFLTHTRRADDRRVPAYRTDIHKMAQLVGLFGPKGEYGLSVPETADGRQSFRLSDLMQANTRLPGSLRDVPDGAEMPDHAHYNPALGHQSAVYDALATLGLKQYLRKIAPHLVRHAELLSDDALGREIIQGQQGFADQPVMGLGISAKGKVFTAPAMALGMDEQAGDFKRVLMIRLDTDPATYRYRGIRLQEMSQDQIAAMMREQAGQPEALFQIVSLRKNPLIVDAETLFASGQHHGIDPESLEERRHYMLQNLPLTDRIMQAFNQNFPEYKGADRLANPLPEDEIFSQIGPLERYRVRNDQGEIVDIPDLVHARAEDIHNHQVKVDRLLRKILGPDPIEWRADDPDVLDEFCEKIKKTSRSLMATDIGRVWQQSDFNNCINAPTASDAVTALWGLRKKLMDRFYDPGRHYEIIDDQGTRVSFDDVMSMTTRERHGRFDSGSLKVALVPLISQPSMRKMARMFWDAGRIEALGDDWQDWMQAEIALYQHGEPMLEDDQQRYVTGPHALRDIRRLRENALSTTGGKASSDRSERGEYDRFARSTDQALEILEQAENFIRQRMQQFPLTPEAMVATGWNPQNGRAIDWIRHEVPADEIMVTTAPDALIRTPLAHPDYGTGLIVMPLPAQIRQHVADGGALVLQGAESGAQFLAAMTSIKPAPPKTADYFWQQITNAYADSGLSVDAGHPDMVMIMVADTYPLAGTRTPDPSQQTLHVRGQQDFLHLVSAPLGYDDRTLQGMMMREYDYIPKPGPVRLLETDDQDAETGWELAGNITAVKSITLPELRLQARRKEWPSERTRQYGFSDANHMIGVLSRQFSDQLVRPLRAGGPATINEEKIMIIDLDPVDRQSMLWNPRHVVPEASVERDFLNPDRAIDLKFVPNDLSPAALPYRDMPGQERQKSSRKIS